MTDDNSIYLIESSNYRTLLKLVKDCRSAQKKYFKDRSSVNLQASKQKEKLLDDWITINDVPGSQPIKLF